MGLHRFFFEISTGLYGFGSSGVIRGMAGCSAWSVGLLWLKEGVLQQSVTNGPAPK